MHLHFTGNQRITTRDEDEDTNLFANRYKSFNDKIRCNKIQKEMGGNYIN